MFENIPLLLHIQDYALWKEIDELHDLPNFLCLLGTGVIDITKESSHITQITKI